MHCRYIFLNKEIQQEKTFCFQCAFYHARAYAARNRETQGVFDQCGVFYWKENLVKYRIQTMEEKLVISFLAIHPLYMGGIVSCVPVLPLFQDISLT